MHAIQNAAAYYRVQQDPAAADTYGVLPWVIRCGMTVCSYLLTNQGAGAGGFACVPGSVRARLWWRRQPQGPKRLRLTASCSS